MLSWGEEILGCHVETEQVSEGADRAGRAAGAGARALGGRADLPGPGRVGVRLLRAGKRPPLGSRRRGGAAARADPRAARRQLLRLRLPADVEGAAAGRRASAALPGAAADARQRDRRCEAAWQAVADDEGRSAGAAAARPRPARLQRLASERALGRRPELSALLARARLLRVRDRRLQSDDRRLATRTHMRTDLVLDALKMALGLRGPGADVELVHHSDRGAQGGFNWSSQHLVMEVVRDGCSRASAGGSRDAWADVVARSAVDRATGGSAAVLAGDRSRLVERGGGRRGGSVAGGWEPGVPRRGRGAAHLLGPAVGGVSLL